VPQPRGTVADLFVDLISIVPHYIYNVKYFTIFIVSSETVNLGYLQTAKLDHMWYSVSQLWMINIYQ